MRHVGLDPLTVIKCATRTGAEILGWEKEVGTLEAGKLADVLVVDGDVLGDIRILEDRSRFVAVMQQAFARRWASRAGVCPAGRRGPPGRGACARPRPLAGSLASPCRTSWSAGTTPGNAQDITELEALVRMIRSRWGGSSGTPPLK